MPVRLRVLLVVLAALASAAVAGQTAAADRPNDAWAATRINAPATWTNEPLAPVTIAVLDTGVDPAQPELAGKLVGGYDAVDGAGSTADAGWHGTAVASIAGGASDSGVGMASYCPRCLVMPVKVLDEKEQGSDPEIAQGIRWAVDHGARVINLSLSGGTEARVLAAAIRYADNRGVVVVAAAGNDGSRAPSYPAADPHAIGVAATDPADRLYPWSNRGRWVSLAAPGVNMSAVPGAGLFAFSGTSSAAAVVSGVAGLCLANAPALPSRLVRRALVAGAAPVAGAPFGRIDAARTVALCRSYAAR